MQPRRSNRELSTPARFGYPAEEKKKKGDTAPVEENILSTIESDTIKEEDKHTMVDQAFSTSQLAAINEMLKTAVVSALAVEATEDAARKSRALTADLQPAVDHYLPKIDNSVKPVDSHKIRYPRLLFTDHNGEIEYNAWKMDMKLFIEEFSGNFCAGDSQVKAYFKCTGGEAKTIILQHMDTDVTTEFKGAADVLAALDQRFFDHNRVQKAKAAYSNLKMTSNMTYNQFRIKFTNLAITGKIARARWFDDVCEKISPALKLQIMTEKYKMSNNYTILDEFLAVTDRESRNILAEDALHKKVVAVAVGNNASRNPSILKKSGWTAERLTADAARNTPAVRFPTTPETVPQVIRRTLSATNTCRLCRKEGHWARDCPNAVKIAELTGRSVEELMLEHDDGDEDGLQPVEVDELSGNS